MKNTIFSAHKTTGLVACPIPSPSILFIDDNCSLCCRAAQLVNRYDIQGNISVASLHGKMASTVLQGQLEIRNKVTDKVVTQSIIWCGKDRRIRCQSSAVMAVAHSLGGWFRLVLLFWFVPTPLRDALYRTVARRRHWFEIIESCVFRTS